MLEFPCCLDGLNIKLRSEIMDAELPFLLRNNSLEKAKVVLDIGNKKIKLFDNTLKR